MTLEQLQQFRDKISAMRVDLSKIELRVESEQERSEIRFLISGLMTDTADAFNRVSRDDSHLVLGQCGCCWGINRHEPSCELNRRDAGFERPIADSFS